MCPPWQGTHYYCDRVCDKINLGEELFISVVVLGHRGGEMSLRWTVMSVKASSAGSSHHDESIENVAGRKVRYNLQRSTLVDHQLIPTSPEFYSLPKQCHQPGTNV